MGKSGAVWSGWIMFAGVMMMLMGAFNALEGLAAIFSEDYFVRGDDQLLVLDFTTWGILILSWGVLLLLVGGYLMAGREWARWAAVVVVAINALGHASFMAFPIWNVMVMGLSVVVIFALTVRWGDAQADLNS